LQIREANFQSQLRILEEKFWLQVTETGTQNRMQALKFLRKLSAGIPEMYKDVQFNSLALVLTSLWLLMGRLLLVLLNPVFAFG